MSEPRAPSTVAGIRAAQRPHGAVRPKVLRAVAAVLVAAASYLAWDPSAPESLLAPYEKDPDHLDTREGRRAIERSYRFLISYPWDVYTPEQKEEIRTYFEKMKANYEGDW